MKAKVKRKLLVGATLTLFVIFIFILVSKTYAVTETKLVASDGAQEDYFASPTSIPR